MVIDVLKLAIPTVIAIISLVYAIKQRNIVKSEISKKRYLESAQSNLNEVIKSLKDMEFPSLSASINDFREVLEDDSNNADVLVSELLRASFELKKRKFTMEVSYVLRDLGDASESFSEKDVKEIRNFADISSRWFTDVIKSSRIFILETCTNISGSERYLNNEMDFSHFCYYMQVLGKALDKLHEYEEVYETVFPNSVKNASRLFEKIAKEIVKVVSEPKKVEIDLDKFSKTEDIFRYLFEAFLNYSHIAGEFSDGIRETVSQLTEARKQLFLRIS